MNKSAKEIFEKLGYELTPHKAIIYKGKHETGRIIRIAFFENKKILITESIGLEELQAINQQCKELGWLDDKKKEINYQKPFAIKYMLDNKRLYGTEWYCKLKCLEGSDK